MTNKNLKLRLAIIATLVAALLLIVFSTTSFYEDEQRGKSSLHELSKTSQPTQRPPSPGPTSTTRSPTATTTSTSTVQPTTAPPSTARHAERLDQVEVPEDWLSCVRRFLRLDEHNHYNGTHEDWERAIPLLVTPVMNDAHHLPRMLCSIDVPVRYYYVVLNEYHPLALETVDAMEAAFNVSGRFIVQRNEINAGYSGSMNQGLRWGIERRNNTEVPWVLLSNCDVAFGGNVLTRLVTRANAEAAKDAPVLEQLRAEVAMEERLVAEGNLSYYHKWAPRGRPLHVLRSGYPGVPKDVHTAPLLPDRIRYLNRHENAPVGGKLPPLTSGYFYGHYGMIAPVDNAQSSVIVTRLMVSTVGYLDENFYPAYMEDIDWRWRMMAFGFQKTAVANFMVNYPHNPFFYHFNGGNFLYNKSNHPFDTEDNSTRWAYQRSLGRKGTFYEQSKYGKRNGTVWDTAPVNAQNKYMFFNVSSYPLDVWVTDNSHRRCFHDKDYSYKQMRWIRPDVCVYNCKAIAFAGVLGKDQVKNLRCVDRHGRVVDTAHYFL